MFDRRRVLAALAALVLPAPTGLAAAAPQPLTGVHIVDGWVVTGRDLAAIDRLAR